MIRPSVSSRTRAQTVLTVLRTEWQSPRMVRVIAGGDGFENYKNNEFTDRYVKLLFTKPELGLVPPFDLEVLRLVLPPEDWPVVRTYTVRWVDTETRQLAIDFVIHGDEGIAGPWAAQAQPGDNLVFLGPAGGFVPDPTVDWHLFAGDASALPAISVALAALPSSALGIAYFEVTDDDDIPWMLPAPSGFQLEWLLEIPNPDPADLATTIDYGYWPWDQRVQVFAHGERESMRHIRALVKQRRVPRELTSLSGYWAKGRNEDDFQVDKYRQIGGTH